MQGSHTVEDIGSARCDEEHEGDPEVAGLVGGFGQAHAVRVGDGAAAHGAERAGDDGVAPADPPDMRRDRTDDSLTDDGCLFDLGHQNRM